jgi:hypothetical protein
LTEIPEKRIQAKSEITQLMAGLMPEGRPQYTLTVQYPMVRNLVEEEGRVKMIKVIFLMVADLCRSVNVVRNMNEDQMIEVATMLLEECGNFRIQDYMMFFTMVKRGQLGRIYDRLDIQVISEMLDEFWKRRHHAAEALMEEQHHHLDSLGNTTKDVELMHPQDKRLTQGLDRLSGVMGNLKERLKDYLPIKGGGQ